MSAGPAAPAAARPGSWPQAPAWLFTASRVEGIEWSRGAAIGLLAVFVCRVMVASAVVPPWQGPDEPTHFALARQLTIPGPVTTAAVIDIEREVLRSMARHGWWEHYREPTPEPLPYAFSQVPEHLSSGTLSQPAYYLIASAAMRLVPGSRLEDQYAALRGLSSIMAVLTLVLGWLGTRALFGSMTAIGALTIVALHPQFLLSAVSVNPDVLINLCGAFIWWQIARLDRLARTGRIAAVLLIAAAAVLAVLSKRNGVPLSFIALVGTMAALGYSLRRACIAAACASAAVAGVFALLLSAGGEYGDSASALATYWQSVLVVRRPLEGLWPPAMAAFVFSAIDTSWLHAGWLRYPAPDPWYWVVRLVTLAGFGGAVWLWRRGGTGSRALRLAFVFVAIQTVTLLGVTFVAGSVPQGRYFFAVMFPAAALIWCGLLSLAPAASQRRAVLGLACLVAALDASALALVLLPAYAR